MSSQTSTSYFNQGMVSECKDPYSAEDIRVTVTIENKLTGKKTEMHFPKVRQLEGMVESVFEYDTVVDDNSLRVLRFPMGQRMNFEMKFTGLHDEEAGNMCTLTNSA